MIYKKLPGVYHGKKNHPLADKKKSSPAKAVDAALIQGADTTGASRGTGGSIVPGDPWSGVIAKNQAVDSAEEVTDPDTGEILAKAGTWKAYRLNKSNPGDSHKEDMENKYVVNNDNDIENKKID